jgi:hypothetical protein
MSARKMVQIVPIRARAPEGVGDYAMRIAERMEAEHGVGTSFISCTPLPEEKRLHDRWQTLELTRRHTADLAAALEREAGDAPVLLQLSGYGFHRRALTFWVADAIRRWRRGGTDRRVLTVFHELYATGPIWSTPFWFGELQKLGVRRNYRQSVAAIATTERNIASLRGWEPDGPPLAWMPCFATIGEPAGPTPLASERTASVAIFGRASAADSVYRESLVALEDFVHANNIAEIIDIGARPTPPPAEIAGVPVRALGELAPAPLIAELSKARFGLLHYEANRLAKSSIFGALCACGTIPVCISGEEGRQDQLVPGGNYLKLDPGQAAPAPRANEHDRLQAGARSWYEPHAIAAAVDLIHGHLFAGSSDVKA